MADKPRILIVADWFYPAFKAGGPVRSVINLVNHLHGEYDFSIICGCCDYAETEPLKGITPDCWTDWEGKARVYYMSREKQSRRAIFDLLDVTDAEVVYVQGIFSRIFSILPVIWWHQAKREKLVVAPRGMLHESALSIKPLKKKGFLLAARIMGWYNNVVWHSSNPEETIEIRKVMGDWAEILEAPNFPVYARPGASERTSSDELRLLCVSRISDEKNPLLLLQALKQVSIPVRLTIAGDYLDQSYFRRFEQALAELPEHVRTEYLGPVEPEKLEALYRNHDLFVLPTRGENFGHAIAEALMNGLPVLIGENTPWTGLEAAGAGQRLVLDPQTFAAAITDFYSLSPEARAMMSSAAIAYVNDRLGAEGIKEAYRALFVTEPQEEDTEE